MLELFTIIAAWITMAIVAIAEITKWKGLQDEVFERELARLNSLVDRLKIRTHAGKKVELNEGVLVMAFANGGLGDIINKRNLKTVEDIRAVFGRHGEYRQFSHTEHYFLFLKNLMRWVDKRKFRRTRYKYAQRVVGSLTRDEVNLLCCYCIVAFPHENVANELKKYVEKYGMLCLLMIEIEDDQIKTGIEYHRHFNTSAFIEGGTELPRLFFRF